MIYAIENGQKVPLGAQFSNDWQIEYDRDLSSQLSGKSEWTATEDCWFQFHALWYRPNSSASYLEYVKSLHITVNDVVVDKIAFDLDGSTINGILSASVLLKKGDVIKCVSTNYTYGFNTDNTKIFPIHRILSNREGERDRSYAIWNTERNADYWLIADKPQGVVHVSFLANNQWMDIIWNVATAETRQMGPTGGDAIFRGMEDPVYGRPYLMVRTTENIGSYFIDTVDCVLTVERRPH